MVNYVEGLWVEGDGIWLVFGVNFFWLWGVIIWVVVFYVEEWFDKRRDV